MKMEKQEVLFDTVVTIFNIKFENTVYTDAQAAAAKLREAAMPVRASILFDMFPFCILFQVCSLICVQNQRIGFFDFLYFNTISITIIY